MDRLTLNEITNLSRNPTERNIKRLQQELARTEKSANIRIRAIEKYANTKKSNREYIDKFAYGLVKEYLSRVGLEYFDSSVTSAKSLRLQLISMNKFLSQKTSSVKGIKQLEKNNRATFKRIGLHLKPSEEAKFYEFISSQFVQDIKNLGSERIFKQVLEAIRNGKEIEEMELAYEKYRSGEIEYIDTAWESWAEVSPFGD